MIGAFFKKADLSGSILEDVKLEYSSLRGAILNDISGIECKNLVVAFDWECTKRYLSLLCPNNVNVSNEFCEIISL